MQHTNNMKKIRMKLLGLFTAALILFGGMTGLTAALAEDTAQEAPAQEEYREDSEETGDEDTGAYPEFSAEGGMGVFSAANETYVRESGRDEDGLEEDEYLSYYVNVKNTGAEDCSDLPAYFRVDGGKEIPLDDLSLDAGKETQYHISLADMAGLTPGLHEIEVFVNDDQVFTDRFYIARDWDEIMRDPTADQIAAVSSEGRSPYIVYYPQFGKTAELSDYSIDFSVDDAPKGTYLATINTELDVSSLTSKGLRLTENYGTFSNFYCGIQRWLDGRSGIIMSVWDILGKDAQGNSFTIQATPIYTDEKAEIQSHTPQTNGEGSFQQFTVEYPWEARHPYRMTLQTGKNEESGNATLTMQMCDLKTNEWKKLITWDLGYQSKGTGTKYLAGFLENYDTASNGEVRTANFSNIRGRSASSGEWQGVDTVRFTVNNSQDAFNYIGSYRFGADDSSFYAITSGVSGLCEPSTSGTVLTVRNTADDSPY